EVLSSGAVLGRVLNGAAINLGTVTFGTWHQAVLRYDGGLLTLEGFLDGVKSASRVTGLIRQTPTAQFYALGATDTTNLGSGAYFKGQIDEFRIWRIARPDPEIQAGRLVVVNGSEPGLVLGWRLDGNALDQGPLGRNGSLVNGATFADTAPTRGFPIGATDADPGDEVFFTVATDTPTTLLSRGTALGFNGASPDAAYDMSLDPRFTAIPHTSSTLTIDWFAGDAGWQGGNDESWALDNVAVVLDSQTSNSRTVFATAFDGAVPPQFSGGTLESVQGYAGIGVNGDTFGGNLYRNATTGNPAGKTRLTLTGLPAHQTIDLRFLLAIIDSWEGSTTVNGPDRFIVTVDGQTRFSETFGSLPSVPQSYVPTPGVTPRLQGGQVVLTTSPTFAGTARITVTAADDAKAGRTDTLRWDFTAGANAVYGSTFEDLDRDGMRDPGDPSVALVPVFLDANGNNIADPGETLTYS
ncbi:MAG: hypothetical protein AUI36_46790, partial [Cyanobacteria bacterium 13_1_40CM_2_61_4]